MLANPELSFHFFFFLPTGREEKKNQIALTFVSFSLLAVGSWDAQNAVDGVRSRRVVGGAGYGWRGRAGNWEHRTDNLSVSHAQWVLHCGTYRQ